MAASLLTLRDVVVRYGERTALRIPWFSIEAGHVLAIIGPNGAGKSTVLRLMGLLQIPNEGEIFFHGENALNGDSLRFRRRIATVLQEPLLLNATVYQNAALGLKLRGFSSRAIEGRLWPWLERLGIAPLALRSARSLSGGEARRTSLARALALEPELLLLDEPFAALDPASREELLGDFLPIVKETKMTTVFVTHDREEGFALAERVAVFQDGRLLQVGARSEVFFQPNSAAVAEIVGIANRLWGTIEASDGDLATVRVDEQIVRVAGTFQTGAKVLLCIRPENILVKPSEEGAAEGFNQLGATIVAITAAITHHRITLACGTLRLTAVVDRTAFLEADYREGESVVAVFNPSAVHAVIENHAAGSTALPTK